MRVGQHCRGNKTILTVSATPVRHEWNIDRRAGLRICDTASLVSRCNAQKRIFSENGYDQSRRDFIRKRKFPEMEYINVKKWLINDRIAVWSVRVTEIRLAIVIIRII